MSKIEDALAAASETRALIIGSGVLAEAAVLFATQFPQQKAVIIADATTYKVAGESVHRLLDQAGISQLEPFVYKDPELYAEYTYVEQLSNFLKTTTAIPIAVGSGTINDLTKLASFLTDRQYMCVATAASMDGYTAFGASITANGSKQTFNCPAPQACLADIDIISKAPTEMTAAGYADLFAKVTSGADWILADELGVETIDHKAWSIVQDGLHESLADPEGVRQGKVGAITKLVEGLMLSGFAIQWHKTSRPASGAEHQFSHLWNMENHLNHGEHVSHGFQVSIGTIAITALYECFLNANINELDISSSVANWPLPEVADATALAIFKNTDFPEVGLHETRAKYIDREQLEQQLHKLKENWNRLRRRLRNQIVPYQESIRRLALVGAPTAPEQIGISRERLKETFVRAQFIRRRFTILDIAVRTRLLDQWLDQLFGKGSIWEIKQD